MEQKNYYYLILKKSFLLLLFWAICFTGFAQKPDMDKLKGIKPRSIGPAGMSGRVTAIDAVVSQPEIIYVGSASGGLWKSENGGIAFKPIFDDQKIASIGAVAINQKNPDEIWVGTGEGNPRNSLTSGAGIYKSLDGGKTWKCLGLEKTRNIHRIIIHPDNSDILYVAAIGYPWGESQDRGVFKTTDGGKTWKKMLFVNEKTGVADLIIDPKNPNKLIAAMWEHRRWPWFFKSGGEGSGLYITVDGGENWEKRTEKNGLPSGELGRIGIAIAKSNPNVLYALIESKKNALYRSADGGSSWVKTTDKGMGDRPFYYAEIYVDSKNENRVFSLYSSVAVSEDGGKNFKVLLPWSGKATDIHPDHHAWWIHPENPNLIMEGNDGGFNISYDSGKTWRFAENLPLGQFYHINVDMAIPYNVMGGLQDNGSWIGPGYVWKEGGIRNTYFQEILFGDGFDVVPDESDSRYAYAMSQGGNLARVDLTTGHTKSIVPVHPENKELRFNWNAGIAHDPFDKKTIYYGSQYLHKSTDRGDNWAVISPDLTTNDPEKQKTGISGGDLTFDATGAENHTTIISIAPSPIQAGVIWVGTDDGNLQLTQDGGKTWTNMISKLKGVPTGSWIPQIHASKHNAGEAFVVINNYRQDDLTPYLFHTKDFGKTWTRLIDENKVGGYALSVVQDPVEPKLLFLGTEFGLYMSLDYGQNWTQWKHNYPANLSTMDMVIHPREHDLVVGTFGRAIYIFDDIRPLRAIAKEGLQILDKPIYAFQTPDAYLAEYIQAAGIRFAGNAIFTGDNRPSGAMLSFSVKEIKKEKTDSLKVKVEIVQDGKVIRTLKIKPQIGINRFQWNLDQKGVRFPNSPKPTQKDPNENGGISVLPGTYTVRYTYGDDKDSTTIKVLPDPRINVVESNLIAKVTMLQQVEKNIALATEIMDRLNSANETVEIINKQMQDKNDDNSKLMKDKAKAIQDSIKTIKYLIVNKEDIQGILRNPDVLSAKQRDLYSALQSSFDKPDAGHHILLKGLEDNLKSILNKTNTFFAVDWKNFQEAVQNNQFSIFKTYEPLELK